MVFATATVLAALRWRQDYYLFVIGAVAFTAATVGYLHRRRHRPGDTGHIAGMGGSYVAMLTAFYVDKSTEVIHNFGRADQVDRAALARLVASISR